jgi:hypothetical protein
MEEVKSLNVLNRPLSKSRFCANNISNNFLFLEGISCHCKTNYLPKLFQISLKRTNGQNKLQECYFALYMQLLLLLVCFLTCAKSDKDRLFKHVLLESVFALQCKKLAFEFMIKRHNYET